MASLVQYARFTEALGVEKIVRGVDASRLPAPTEELRQTIARVSLNAWSNVVLKPTDLVNCYGLLAYFFSSDQLARIDKARGIEERMACGGAVSDEHRRIFEEGLDLLVSAARQLASAKADLEAHAAALR